MRATKAIIHLSNIEHNIKTIQRILTPNVKICVPVKADAYGHGAVEVSRSAIKAGAAMLAVATVDEALELRAAGITHPLLLLGISLPEEIPEIVEHGISTFVADLDYIDALEREAKKKGAKAKVHLKVDTGMSRIGCRPHEAVTLAARIAKSASLSLEGTATHLAVSDSALKPDDEFTLLQIERFQSVLDTFKKSGINGGLAHIANSGAVARFPQAAFDMVRPGILVYGYAPAPDAEGLLNVRPVMELQTQIVSIHKIEKGTSVSYGRAWKAPADTMIATIPVGYADGILRRCSPGLQVTVGGALRPVVGRICMDQCMVDLGMDSGVSRWDTVTVFGEGEVTAATVARLCNTIPYEITCGINAKRVPRVYQENR